MVSPQLQLWGENHLEKCDFFCWSPGCHFILCPQHAIEHYWTCTHTSSCYSSAEVQSHTIPPNPKHLCQEQPLFTKLCTIHLLSLILASIPCDIHYTAVTFFNCDSEHTDCLCQAFKSNSFIHLVVSCFVSLCFLITSLVLHNFHKHEIQSPRRQNIYLHSSSLLLPLIPVASIYHLSSSHKNCGKKATMHATKQWRDQHWI